MDLEDTNCRARFLIRDRDGKFPQLFDDVLADAGLEVVLSGVQMPRIAARRRIQRRRDRLVVGRLGSNSLRVTGQCTVARCTTGARTS
jgi:hypothetical protein